MCNNLKFKNIKDDIQANEPFFDGEKLLAKLHQKQIKSILDGLSDEAQKIILSSDMPEVSGYPTCYKLLPKH